MLVPARRSVTPINLNPHQSSMNLTDLSGSNGTDFLVDHAYFQWGGVAPKLDTRQFTTDTFETLVFKRNLEGFLPQFLKEDRPPRNFGRMVPVDDNFLEWDESTGWRMWTGTGTPVPLRGGGQSMPEVSLKADETLLPVATFGLLARWDIAEMGKTMQSNAITPGIGLQTAKLMIMREAFEAKANNLGFYGDRALGIVGLLNNQFIKHTGFVTSTGVLVTLNANSTQPEIFDAFGVLIMSIRNDTGQVQDCNRVAICTSGYAYLRTTPYSTQVDTTMLDFLKKTYLGVDFFDAAELDLGQKLPYGSNGFIQDDFVIAMDSRLSGLGQAQPIPFRLLNQRPSDSYAWKVPGLMRCGSTLVPKPLAVKVAKNVLGRRVDSPPTI